MGVIRTCGYDVRVIERTGCEEYILRIHYAKRWPSISYAFGLYLNDELCGVVTYGTPPSAPLRKGIAGEEYKSDVVKDRVIVTITGSKGIK